MTTILILGGYGQTGKLLARHLLEQTGADVILAGRSLEKALACAALLSAEFPGERVSARQADAASRESLLTALAGTNFLLVAAPTTAYAATVARAALDAGVDYLDVQLDAGKLKVLQSMAPEIELAGRCFITEAGFHPGMPAALVRHAAAQVDRLDSAVTAGYLNMGHTMPYTDAVDELMEVFQHYEAQVYQNGQWTKPTSYVLRKVNFGGEIGEHSCYSMYFAELGALPQMFPSLREVGFYIAGSNWLVDWIITPAVMLGLKLAPRRGRRPMGKLMWWGMQNFAKPPYIVALKVEGVGVKDGQPARVESVVSHPDGYELTAIPVVACLMQVLDGSARRPGLWMMGHLVDPERLLMDMARMGVQVSG